MTVGPDTRAVRQFFTANGLRLLIESDDSQLQQAFVPYLEPFAVLACDEVDFTVIMARAAAVGPEPGGDCIFDGEILPGVVARLFDGEGENWLLVPDQLSIRFDAVGRQARISVADACSKHLLGYTAIHVIDAALAASGQYLIHGAALALPNREDGSLLLFAPSGRGKTTTALALALSGFGLMTDDAIVLQPKGFSALDCPCAWGLPRALKVHRLTAQLLPAVAPLLNGKWDAYDEQVLTAATLNRVAAVAPARPMKISAIAILGPRTLAEHAFTPLSKATALMLLTEDNVRSSPKGMGATQVARFCALASLAEQTPVFELRVGAKLPELAREILKALPQNLGG